MFDMEPPIHRMGAVEINTFVDNDDIYRRQRATDTGSIPLYPVDNHRPGVYDIRYGELVFTKTNSHLGDPKVYGVTGLAGAGADEMAMYNDVDTVKMAIKSNYNLLGVAASGYNPLTDAATQGFVTAVAGLHSIDIPTGERFDTGAILRAELPDSDMNALTSNVTTPNGAPLSKFAWKPVQENYETSGDIFNKHLILYLQDNAKWAQIFTNSSSLEVDKWQAAVKASYSSSLMDGLLTVYLLLKSKILVPNVPSTTDLDPLTNNPIPAPPFSAISSPEDVVLHLAELWNVIPSMSNITVTPEQKKYYSSLGRRLLSMINCDGKTSNFLFGFTDPATWSRVRNDFTGDVDTTSPQGAFVEEQINHTMKKLGATLQALDEHKKFRIGRVVSGPGKSQRTNIVIEKSY